MPVDLKFFYFGWQCPHNAYRLIQELRDTRFKTRSIDAAEGAVLPNGPMDWLVGKGFVDKGVLLREDLHEATIHHLQLDPAKR